MPRGYLSRCLNIRTDTRKEDIRRVLVDPKIGCKLRVLRWLWSSAPLPSALALLLMCMMPNSYKSPVVRPVEHRYRSIGAGSLCIVLAWWTGLRVFIT